MQGDGRVWFITGCSSGFGRKLSEMLLDRGQRVVVTARDPDAVSDLGLLYPDSALIVRLDVTDPAQNRAAVAQALAAFRRIDVLVNNAGYGVQGPVEDIDDFHIRRVFETNVFGLIDLTRSVLPTLRAQRSGHIINLSSVAGRVGYPLLALYSGTKFAVEGFSEGLASEVASFGIRVTLIEPGPFATDFPNRSMELIPSSEPYRPITDAMQKALAGLPFGDPSEVINAIIHIAGSSDPPLRLVIGNYAVQSVRNSLMAQLAELNSG